MCCKQIVFQAAKEKGGHELRADSVNVLCWFPTLQNSLSYLLIITWRQGSCLFCVGEATRSFGYITVLRFMADPSGRET